MSPLLTRPSQPRLFGETLWMLIHDGDPCAKAIYDRHYSKRHYKDGRDPALFVGPGGKIVLVTSDYSALFVWRKFRDDSGQQGVNCAVFRNESPHLSSKLILDAERWAWHRWPGERLYTYVNGKKILSTNAGYCFLMAKWVRCGKTKGGLVILEKN